MRKRRGSIGVLSAVMAMTLLGAGAAGAAETEALTETEVAAEAAAEEAVSEAAQAVEEAVSEAAEAATEAQEAAEEAVSEAVSEAEAAVEEAISEAAATEEEVLDIAAAETEAETEAAAETEAPAQEAPAEEAPAEAPAAAGATVIDFEDGNFGFVKVNKTKGAADGSTLEVADFNGSKALKMVNVDGGSMYLGVNISALLGDSVANLATIRVDLGTESADGAFYATSGKLYAYTGEENETENAAGDWSVYLESVNPKTLTFDVSSLEFNAASDNYIILSREVDNAPAPQTLYFDNLTFLDASGAPIAVNTAAEFGSPAGFESSGSDTVGLNGVIRAVEFEGFQTSGSGWAQAGYDMPEEIISALVPGSVVEISYTSATGNMWLVMPGAEAGWMRVGVGDCDGSGQGYSYYNASRTVAQVTYEQIAQYCGDDVSTWGAAMQCESDGDWEVYSVRVGEAVPNYCIESGAVELEGAQVSGDAWSQAGTEMSEDFIAALVPGSVVEISYASDTNNMWLVFPGAEAGWMRVGVGDADGSGQGYALTDGSKAYIPYETIAEYCGDDVSKWGTTLQCESDGAWEVYSVRVGKAGEFVPYNASVELEGFQISGGGWGQDGLEMTDDFRAALTEGSVINISYASETGEIWVVFPDSEAGWMRVGVGDYDGSGQGYALFNGSTCQIPFETIAEYLGDDVSTWGARLQCEASSAWEVYSVSVGYTK